MPGDASRPLIVGIGCSAGGVEACQKLFALLPRIENVAFVLVRHLDPEHDSAMSAVLNEVTSFAVEEAEDGVAPRGGYLYTVPADRYPEVRDGCLRLFERDQGDARRNPIDLFFSSLAEHQQSRAVAIVLSGAGYDAEQGARLIKERGGFVIVEEPTTAKFSGMPRQIIDAGLATHVTPLEELPTVLVTDIRDALGFSDDDGDAADLGGQDAAALASMLRFVRSRCGYDFQAYKDGTLMRRVRRRMSRHGLRAPAEYLEVLRADSNEANQLFRDLLISVTSFFREPAAFRYLENEVLPALVSGKQPGDQIRAWVPACATGEEAYSVAMLLLEQVERTGKRYEVTVFGTDVDEQALEIARAGVYDDKSTADVGAERLRRFFIEDGQNCRVSKELREAVVFAPQNALTDPPFSKLDLISCRNLMIYLRPEAQRNLLSTFHFGLIEGGYLFLGNSETAGPSRDLFSVVSKEWRIYRRIGPKRLRRGESSPGLRHSRGEESGAESHYSHGYREREPRRDSLGALVQPMLLQEYAPAAVLVDSAQKILYFSGPTSQFLEIPVGEPTLDLVSMARDGLATKLRAGLHRALREDMRITVNARVLIDGERCPTQIDIRPLRTPKALAGLLLITFARQQGETYIPEDGESEPHASDERVGNWSSP